MLDAAPTGWRRSTLGVLASTQLGKAINPKEQNGPSQRPYLRNANVQWDRVDLSNVLQMHFSEAERERLRLEPGDLLTCEGGIVGRSAIWRGEIADCFFQNAIHRIRPLSQEVSAEWLLETLRHLSDTGFLATRARGNTIQHLSQQELRSLPVVLPIREDQDGIVAVLSKARAKAGSAAGHLAAGRRAVVRFQNAVIFAACSGRLSAEWRRARPDQEPADVVLSRHASHHEDMPINKRRLKPAPGLRIVGEREQFPELWAYRRVRELVGSRAVMDVQDGNHGELYPRKGDFTADREDGVPYISAESVSDVVLIDLAPRLKPEIASRLRIGFARRGDVILTHNATVGRVAVMPEDAPDVVLSTSTTYYRVDPRVLLPEYLALYMRSHFFQEQLAAVMEQTTRNQVPVTKQVELSIAVPPVDEQRDILRRVDALLGHAGKLGARIDVAAGAIDRSLQAVLAKAFRGDLMSPAPSETIATN